MRLLIVALALLLSWPASAQPTPPCDACKRGDELIDRFGVASVRLLVPELLELSFDEPLTTTQYASVVALRATHPILGRLGALDDPQLALVAAALCRATDSSCTTATGRALRCLADRCEVTLPPPPKDADVIAPDTECEPPQRKRRPLLGVGFDLGTGIQRSNGTNEGRTTTVGISARIRFSDRFGVVARADRTDGRDVATDLDGDGNDDFQSSAITRFTALVGPSFVLDSTRLESSTRSIRLDLLGGYLATRTLPDESGIAIGADLSMQLSVFRTGVRVVQGFGDARTATMLLAHFGIAIGSTPTHRGEDTCPPRKRSSRLALGFEIPLLGGGFSSQLGVLAGGFGTELVWHLLPPLDAIVHFDIVGFPRKEADRVIHQAALIGLRLDHGKRPRTKRTGWYSTLMAGVTHGAVLEPSTVGTGPIVDAAIAWGAQDDETAGYVRLHSRFGLSSANVDYRAVFLSIGFEMRFDRQRWSDRDRTW